MAIKVYRGKSGAPAYVTPLICAICKKPIPDVKGRAEGNNAQPVAEGRCCDVCNDLVVSPARIARGPV